MVTQQWIHSDEVKIDFEEDAPSAEFVAEASGLEETRSVASDSLQVECF